MRTDASATRSARTRPGEYTSQFTDLMRTVKDEGLLERRHVYYWVQIGAHVAAFFAIWAAFFWLGNSWWQLALAAALGVIVTQFGFLGHDAAHRQMFASPAWNSWTARILAGAFAGLSFAWWRAKHNMHHRGPNLEGYDPDIGPGAIAFTPGIVAQRTTGFAGWFVKRQGWLFFPLLTLEGLNLHAESIRAARDKTSVQPWRRVELFLVVTRLAVYVAILLAFLPLGKAVAFFAVQMAVFGFCLGASFAPAHKGMPIIPPDMKLDFLRRQVMVSRNVRGNPLVDWAMGGLNYQIEHHLFPSMPRCNLRKAQPFVRAHCEANGIDYLEVGLFRSYAIVIDYLNNVGIRARDPFDCPLAAQLRG
ncbi:fatty acid desaturase family protein [Aeromicrobium wangtongii]|uniref:Acyl-CoA desaturase n=1 Tax=Aeromicrobium wangtongii TaxID=2969247 RepID=A0ABY5M909_9ACTN|nr:acyl-CoA desaturase [Aeromicrobium wangtongii]MCD9199885.1 acyl-CoA desaturase [Aeromicrobium wangtongii]UUP13503.1 acyl-CoA desaturase [Aeromicrobium wangtongii]